MKHWVKHLHGEVIKDNGTCSYRKENQWAKYPNRGKCCHSVWQTLHGSSPFWVIHKSCASCLHPENGCGYDKRQHRWRRITIRTERKINYTGNVHIQYNISWNKFLLRMKHFRIRTENKLIGMIIFNMFPTKIKVWKK